jgi:hypothetical protein
LVAKTGHHRLTAGDPSSGITIVLTTNVWDGEPSDLEDEVAALHVLVANMGKTPVMLAPGDLELHDGRGFHYDLYDPGASFYRATDATMASRSYARAEVGEYDPGRSGDFVPILAEGDIARLALPWGVLEPGTEMRGFLYFQQPTRTANEGTLVWHLQTPDHRPIADIRFDLFTSRPSRRRG